ncbi:MAG: bifunctional hydroxymethylpyrimidine kinase/phosphomethylpyrimidine kinase [Hominisplanchenecus sp.]
MMNKKVLTIAGSDCSGGAGIQADLKTMCAHGVYGMSVITAVTAQNTLGVQQVEELPAQIVEAQLSSVLSDIRPDAVKIGMVYSRKNVEAIAAAIDRWKLTNIVLDPVMVSTSGKILLQEDAAEALQELLFPRVTLVTPNLPETGCLIESVSDADREKNTVSSVWWVENAARQLTGYWHTSFLIKGGHMEGGPADYLDDGNHGCWFPGKRIETRHTHGTGCTLSTAIACNLACGMALPQAVEAAKDYLTGAILHHPGIGHGCGPLNHLWSMQKDSGS